MADITPLHLWLDQHDCRPVSFYDIEHKTVAELRISVASWVDRLTLLPGQRWAVYSNSSYEFLAILLALWHLQRTACVPGDNCSGTIEKLRSRVDGFIGDFDCPERLFTNDIPASNLKLTGALKTDFTALEIYTSGSTGDPQSIQKNLAQLNHEIMMLEAHWPSNAQNYVLTTVTHHHAYGVIFRLLWPFCSERIFSDRLCEYMEDIYHQAAMKKPFSLVSSPAHLTRFNSSIDWNLCSEYCNEVVSAAAPLARDQSLLVGELLNTSVREIYGSSETGAIAWRCQQQTEVDALWSPFSTVCITPEGSGALNVSGPSLGKLGRISLPDKVVFNSEGLFQLEGRSDRIAKVEGKRLSLTSIEDYLHKSLLVYEAKALVIKRKREEVAVVVVLSDQGEQVIQEEGRRQLVSQLKLQLSRYFEAVLLPRRWRFVEAMPMNPQGKILLSQLMNMFEKPQNIWPDIQQEQVDEDHATVHCKIPADLVYFDGHFDENPILPGITQLHWAESIGRRLLTVLGTFKAMEAVKFQQVIKPNTSVVLSLSYNRTKNKLTFKYTSEQGVHSSGRICFQ